MDRYFCVLLICFSSQHGLAAEFHLKGMSAPYELIEFSRQSGVQVLYDFSYFHGATLNNVEGEMTPEEALAMMLSDTGFEYDFINEHTVGVTPGAPHIVDAKTLMSWLEGYVYVAQSYAYDLRVKPTARVVRVMPDQKLTYTAALTQ